jgi:O-Antigen ligase
MNAVQRTDSWPRTRRPLPWLFAGFLASVFLVPIDAVHLKVNIPYSSDYDRFFVLVIALVWLGGVILRRRSGRLQLRPKGWAVAMIIFFALSVASIVLNIDRITNLGELSTAEKRLALLVAWVVVFAIFSVSLRVTELRSFAVLIVVLASISALGVLYQEKTGNNVFYSTTSSVLSPVAEVDPAPFESTGDPAAPGRPLISGPTRHALSIASLLGMAVPFAVAFAAMAADLRMRLLWGLLAVLIVFGALETQRRSGVIVPAVAIIGVFAIRPRRLLPLLPAALAVVAVGLVVSGGSVSTVGQLTGDGDQASTEGRSSDYAAVVPDVLTHPAIGRGYGTLDSTKSDTYRIFDNEYLGVLFQVGLLGLLAFLAAIFTPVVIAVRHVARSDNPLRGPPALGAAAGCLAFAVATGLYDIFSFPQAPYLFLFLAAMCTCAASVERVPAPGVLRRGRAVKDAARQRGRSRPALVNPS